MANLIIGKYIRLSQSDNDLGIKTESESISNQRALIQKFIDYDPLLTQCKQYEFFDDGFSGTNFERPAFEELMKKVKNREINCIIVKDFSRFGRDYIELGNYLEIIFPLLCIRFISINDNYDSNNYQGRSGGLDIALKNLVYDYYSKDLSVKVSTAKRIKMQKGLYGGVFAPYGLKNHPTQKGILIIDEESANVVRRIFTWTVQGFKTSEIAERLNKEKIPTPSQYYVQKNPTTKRYKESRNVGSWNTSMVLSILKKKIYYGAAVGHKREVVKIGSSLTKSIPEKEQIVVEGMHQAIISKETWLEAQTCIKSKKRYSNVPKEYPLKGKVRCGHCKRLLSYTNNTKNKYFRCRASWNNPNAKCSKENLYVANIETVVWNVLQNLFASINKIEKNIISDEKKKKQNLLYIEETLKNLKEQLHKKESMLFLLMDQLNEGKIEKSVFISKKTQLKTEMETIYPQIDALEKKKQEATIMENNIPFCFPKAP